MNRSHTLAGLVLLTFLFGSVSAEDQTLKEGLENYERSVRPLLTMYCARCHGPRKQQAEVRFDRMTPDLVKGGDGEHWEEVFNQLNVGEMPPKKEKQPTARERAVITDWVAAQMRHAAEVRRSTGGRNVLRRLTAYEYANTMRDLLGMDLNYAENLPPESAAKEGFNNNSLVLGVSSLHLEYFQAIAKDALRRALVSGDRPQPFELRVEPEGVQKSGDATSKKKNKKTAAAGTRFSGTVEKNETGVLLGGPSAPAKSTKKKKRNAGPRGGAILMTFDGVPSSGPIRVRIRAGALKVRDGLLPRLHVELGYDGGSSARPTRVLASVDVAASADEPEWHEFHVRAERFELAAHTGKKQFLQISNAFDPGTSGLGAEKFPRLLIDSVELIAPFHATWPPKTHSAILLDSPHGDDEPVYAREVLERFMRRAYRRPPTPEEVGRMHRLFLKIRPKSESFQSAITDVLSAVLSAPAFLMLAEPALQPSDEPPARALTDHELATRLSYFLWATSPDEELASLADQ
ncbi:MAG: DUF1587 domain-containing protein, partial [Planctomycetales bacterium]